MSHTPTIPVVDLRDLHGDATRDAFIQTLGGALAEFGFVAIEGHGLDPDLLENTYAAARAVFALSEEAKRRCEDPAPVKQRGYTAFGVEHAKDTAVPDLKEFWHVGPELSEEHPLRQRGLIPPNYFPAEVPAFRAHTLALHAAMERMGRELLDAIGAWLGKPASFFRELVEGGNSVLRIIHYPDVGGAAPAGAIRAAAHEDINLITLLPASTRPGLELMTRDGQWMAVTTPPNVIICDTGDMMALLTAGKLPATTHRVVNPDASDGGRMSIPFFMHPHADAILDPIVPGYAAPIRTHDFLMQRLKAIGL
jgi:isopenicillin N synthase-like dioxygenase